MGSVTRRVTYERAWLFRDLLAGLTLWAVIAPQAVAYAEIARVPPQIALGMVPVAMTTYVFFGPSRKMVAAVNSAMAITSASVVGTVAGGDPALMLALTPALTLLSGGILFLGGFLRLGFLTDFVAKPVITGFLLGVAVLIIVGQLPKVLGVPVPVDGFLGEVMGIAERLPDLHVGTLLVGSLSLAALFALDQVRPSLPGMSLLVVVLGILASIIFGLEEKGVKLVGSIPKVTPSLSLPAVSWKDLQSLLTGALGLAIVAFAETLAIARRLAASRHRLVHSNRELMALGTANLGVGLMGGFGVCGSLSATEVNQGAGAKSALAVLLGASFILITGLFFTGALQDLPQAVLGAVVIQAAAGSIRINSFARLLRLRRADFALALVALFGVLGLGILQGLSLAVLLSLGWLVARASRTPFSILGILPDQIGFEDLATSAIARPIPGMLIFRLNVPLFFANARRVHGIVGKVLEREKPKTLVIDMELTWELDTTGLDEVVALLEEAEQEGILVCFARMRAPVRGIFSENSQLSQLGEDRIFLTIHAAVAHHRKASAPSRENPEPGKK